MDYRFHIRLNAFSLPCSVAFLSSRLIFLAFFLSNYLLNSKFYTIFAPNLTKKSGDGIPRSTEQHNEKFKKTNLGRDPEI